MYEPGSFEARLVAARNGDGASMFYVAECYDDGIGTPTSVRLAAQWFERAAKHGVVDAMYELAARCIEGKGVLKNQLRARLWLERAYKADHLTGVSGGKGSFRRNEATRLVMSMELKQKH